MRASPPIPDNPASQPASMSTAVLNYPPRARSTGASSSSTTTSLPRYPCPSKVQHTSPTAAAGYDHRSRPRRASSDARAARPTLDTPAHRRDSTTRSRSESISSGGSEYHDTSEVSTASTTPSLPFTPQFPPLPPPLPTPGRSSINYSRPRAGSVGREPYPTYSSLTADDRPIVRRKHYSLSASSSRDSLKRLASPPASAASSTPFPHSRREAEDGFSKLEGFDASQQAAIAYSLSFPAQEEYSQLSSRLPLSSPPRDESEATMMNITGTDYVVLTHPPPRGADGTDGPAGYYGGGEEILNDDDDVDYLLNGPPKQRRKRGGSGGRPQARDDMERTDTSDLAAFLRNSEPQVKPDSATSLQRSGSLHDGLEFLKDEPKRKGFFSKARDAMTGSLSKKTSYASLKERADKDMSVTPVVPQPLKSRDDKEIEFDAQLRNEELTKVILPNGSSYYSNGQQSVHSTPRSTTGHRISMRSPSSVNKNSTASAVLPSSASISSQTGGTCNGRSVHSVQLEAVSNTRRSTQCQSGNAVFNDPSNRGQDVAMPQNGGYDCSSVLPLSGSVTSMGSVSISDPRKQAGGSMSSCCSSVSSGVAQHLTARAPEPLSTPSSPAQHYSHIVNSARGGSAPTVATTPLTSRSSAGQEKTTNELIREMENHQLPVRSPRVSTRAPLPASTEQMPVSKLLSLPAGQPSALSQRTSVTSASSMKTTAAAQRDALQHSLPSSSAATGPAASPRNGSPAQPASLPADAATASLQRPPREPSPYGSSGGGKAAPEQFSDPSPGTMILSISSAVTNSPKAAPSALPLKAINIPVATAAAAIELSGPPSSTSSNIVDAERSLTPLSTTSRHSPKPPEPAHFVRPDSPKEDLLAAIAHAPKNYSHLSMYSTRTELWRALEATRAAAILAENRHNSRMVRQQRLTRKTIALLEASLSAPHTVGRRPSHGSIRSNRTGGPATAADDARVRKHVAELKQSLKGKGTTEHQKDPEYTPKREVKDEDSELVSDDFTAVSSDNAAGPSEQQQEQPVNSSMTENVAPVADANDAGKRGDGAGQEGGYGGTRENKGSFSHAQRVVPGIVNGAQATTSSAAAAAIATRTARSSSLSSSRRLESLAPLPTSHQSGSASIIPRCGSASGRNASRDGSVDDASRVAAPLVAVALAEQPPVPAGLAGAIVGPAPAAVPTATAAVPPPLAPFVSTHASKASIASISENPYTSKASLQISEQDAAIFARFAASAAL
ncbi:hypothetical protein K437DRAFT_121534 [Tilletiaria anomala UBC 951]|uniref:Uncharacterized protein n=1 Tax=Tilletiaria anomala (strain ATCC 24038 / CBS 436.72 / UBC 951) TaxID=1037660 RepID=A0A066W2Z7_TILAU|nr:uncharacterized protein K437DRAFT_121534 [Tilletiaria anomala UBC 951]KDN45449.1 hypothetical protein K437DRAFT_121534 [Tilletiaria anomala UBC 951]